MFILNVLVLGAGGHETDHARREGDDSLCEVRHFKCHGKAYWADEREICH